MRRRWVEAQSGIGRTDPNSRVDPNDSFEIVESSAPEVSCPRVVGAELCLQTFPGNQSRLLEIAHPVGEPDVEVDGEGRSLQLTDRSEIDRDSRAGDLFEEVLAQDDVRSPDWLSWEQSSQRLQPRSTTRSHECRARRSRGEAHRGLPFEPHVQKAMKLILESTRCASGSADRRQTQLASQVVGRGAELDLRTLGADGLGGQVGEQQPRDRSRRVDRRAEVRSFEGYGDH